jgi:hypothetical protein
MRRVFALISLFLLISLIPVFADVVDMYPLHKNIRGVEKELVGFYYVPSQYTMFVYVDKDSLSDFVLDIQRELSRGGATSIGDTGINIGKNASKRCLGAFDDFVGSWAWADMAVTTEKKWPSYYTSNEGWMTIFSENNKDYVVLVFAQ